VSTFLRISIFALSSIVCSMSLSSSEPPVQEDSEKSQQESSQWVLKKRMKTGVGLFNSCCRDTDGTEQLALANSGWCIVAMTGGSDVLVLERKQDGESFCMKKLKGHSGCVSSIAINGEGSQIVTGSDDTTAKVWSRDRGRWTCRQTLSGHTEKILSVSCSEDGDRLVTGSSDKTLKFWECSGNRFSCRLTEQHDCYGGISLVALNKAGTRSVGVSSLGKKVYFFNLCNNHWSLEHSANVDCMVKSIALNRQGDSLLLAYRRIAVPVELWRQKEDGNWLCEASIENQSNQACSAMFNQEGNQIVVGFDGGAARVYDVQDDQLVFTGALPHKKYVTSAVFNDDGTIVTASGGNNVNIWNKRQD